jgi:DNA ligase 1
MKPNLAIEADPKYPLTWPKYASIKLDGIRCVTNYGDALTRSLKPIPNQALRELLQQYQGLDGELIYGEPNASDVYHKTFSAVMSMHGTVEGISYYVFDILDKVLPYELRYFKLLEMQLPDFIKVLPQQILHGEDMLTEFYTESLAQGYEGAILRNMQAIYKEGRSTAKAQDMIKVKPFIDSDAIVLDVYEAMTNNNEAFTDELGRTARSTHAANLEPNGMCGGFTVQMGDKVFNIAAGQTNHQERKEIWENKEKYIGQLLTFRHLAIGAKDVPRHGRFIKWRSKLDT